MDRKGSIRDGAVTLV